MPIQLQASAIYPSLKKAEQKVADILITRPETIRTLSITQTADLCGVSQATVTRFCRTLGFNGYTDFMYTLVAELAANGPANIEVHSDISDDDDHATLLSKVFRMDIQAIQDTMDHVDIRAFGETVEAIASARTVAVFGVGSSQPVAMDLYYRLLRSGVSSIFSNDNHMQAINAALLTEHDVALAVSHSGETQDVVDCIELAAASGAKTLCITSFAQSRLAAISSVSLTTSAKKSFWLSEAIPSRLAQLALCDAICVAIARLNEMSARPVAERIVAAVTRKRR